METAKRALIVGIDRYDRMPRLTGCVSDARALARLLERHASGDSNYACHLLTGSGAQPVTRAALRAAWHGLFDGFAGHILFHFSGHGTPTRTGGVLVTQDGTPDEPGLFMDELLTLACRSQAKSILLLLDCCHAGLAGDPGLLQPAGAQGQALLREGVTVLAGAGSAQTAREAAGRGVFSSLVQEALAGGAADVRGRVSAAGIYAYVEQALGAWEQRPLYKSYADHLPPVRLCAPAVPDAVLRRLPRLFTSASSRLALAPSFEFTHPSAKPAHVALFNKFKLLRNANLLTTRGGKDLFFIALESGWVQLTALGRFYWHLARKGLL